MGPLRHRLLHACAALVASVLSCAALAAPASASEGTRGKAATMMLRLPDCDRWASPNGDDSASGRRGDPVRSAQALIDMLGPGRTGCLKTGDYPGGAAFRTGGGTSNDRRVVLRNDPGEKPVIHGQVYLADGSDFVTVAGLELDGTTPNAKPSPMVNGDDALFVGNDVYSDTESCFVLGDKVWGVPERTRIIGNDIHHCGVPNTNQDHGIYVRQAVGTVIEGNVIRSNPDRGIQFFPNGDDSIVRGNVIDDNGEGIIFSGDSIDASDGNVVDSNLITNSRVRTDVDFYWTGGVVGGGNVVRRNCIWGGMKGEVKQPITGFSLGTNTLADPLYERRKRPRLAPESPCKVKIPVLP